jgi:hypothetical protein
MPSIRSSFDVCVVELSHRSLHCWLRPGLRGGLYHPDTRVWVQKLYSVVSLPPGVILNTVPLLFVPPKTEVP